MTPKPVTVRRISNGFVLIALLASLPYVAAPAAETEANANEWKAPARAARKKNPYPADAASLKAGKTVYAAECADCHGDRGAGDGPGARDLKSPVPDLARPDVWRQTDGELFWKLSTGRRDMPGFDDMLTEEQRWQVITYARAALAPHAAGDRSVPSGAGTSRAVPPMGKP
jgi:mono/diheme cytochrome c family protein